jgi:hypothetical protein
MCLGVNMAHYAFLDQNNIVTEVIVGKDEGEEGIDWEQHYGNFKGQTCKRTSYNTHGNQHPNNQAFRKNYAGIGYVYDEQKDAFIPPKPFPSWVLDEATCLWNSPVLYPTDNKLYNWDEATTSWKELNVYI